MKFYGLMTGVLFLACSNVHAIETKQYLAYKSWQCEFWAELNSDRSEKTGPGGMAQGSKRQFFQALKHRGIKMKEQSGETDAYRETKRQTVEGKIRLHHVYDGGPDGIQLAAWNNGEATVHVLNTFQGSEQHRTVFRDKKTSYDGRVKFAGEEYEPPFQIWIYPAQGTYTLEYHLPPVRGSQIEHCRMKEDMEQGRKKLESASDEKMPLGTFFSGLTKVSCSTERKRLVEIDGGVLSAMVENIDLPKNGLVLSGEADSQFIDTKGVRVSWTCKPGS